jgi:biotin carboxylase
LPRWSTSWPEAAANGIARSRDEAVAVAAASAIPVLIRPSYVLGGRAMEIVDSTTQLDDISPLPCRFRAIARC